MLFFFFSRWVGLAVYIHDFIAFIQLEIFLLVIFFKYFYVFPLFFFGASKYMKKRLLETAPQTTDGAV